LTEYSTKEKIPSNKVKYVDGLDEAIEVFEMIKSKLITLTL